MQDLATGTESSKWCQQAPKLGVSIGLAEFYGLFL